MFLLDTDILVDAARGLDAAVAFLAENEAQAAVSAVTVMELLVGCRNLADWRRFDCRHGAGLWADAGERQ